LYRIICINYSDLKQSNLQKTDIKIINIDIAITKNNTIIYEIEITHVYDLTHACSALLEDVKLQRLMSVTLLVTIASLS
jgi:hypothetical protein